MTRRYFVSDLPLEAGLVALPSEEAQHATRVMRLKPGDSITLFDGKGNEAQAVISHVARNECHCEAGSPERVNREPCRAIHLGVALPRPDRARELVERLTELGVTSLTPIVADRTQRPPSDTLLEKLRRGVIEACKQCGRNQLLQVRPTQGARDFFTGSRSTLRWIAHQSGGSRPLADAMDSGTVDAAIGPEGGWTDDEVRFAADHGFLPVNLGERIYRIETAATVIAALSVS